MPHDGMVPCHLTKAKWNPVLGYFESSPPFFPPGNAQASKASRQCLWSVGEGAYLASQPPLTPNRYIARGSWFYFRERGKKISSALDMPRYVDGRAEIHTWRILLQLCEHVENPMSISLLACHDATCVELRTTTLHNFGPQIWAANPTCVPTINGACRTRCPRSWTTRRCELFASQYYLSPNWSCTSWPSRQCVAGN
jgi:hypothetical protein